MSSRAQAIRAAEVAPGGMKDCGIDGLTDRSRRPLHHANRLPEAIEKLIVRLKREYPT